MASVLIWEDPTCCGTTEPLHRSYWVWALETRSCSCWAHKPHPLKLERPRACTLQPEKPPHWEAQRNQRKSLCSSEDLTQPKTNKQKNVMNAEFGALKSSRLPDQQATRGTKVQERCPPDLGRDPWGTHGPPPDLYIRWWMVSCGVLLRLRAASWHSVEQASHEVAGANSCPRPLAPWISVTRNIMFRRIYSPGVCFLDPWELKSKVTIQSHRFTK